MIIEPKTKGFICITAHPRGCAENVVENISYVKNKNKIDIKNVKNVLVIGASTGYGLSSAIVSSFSLKAKVISVAFEKNADKGRTATAGMYNLAAYKKSTNELGLYNKVVLGDAFSDKVKDNVCDIIKSDLEKIDMLVYSIAAPARIDPKTGERYQSSIKPLGGTYKSKGINLNNYTLTEASIEPASDDEAQKTIKVMGGEDLELWVRKLKKENLLSESAIVLSYSYIGPDLTHDIYINGTIGGAKKHLKETSDRLSADKSLNIQSYVSINKALVTQASAAIPVLPLYISILFRIMKDKNIHEGCIEQMYRLFEKISKDKIETDSEGYIRVDEYEMRDDVQNEVKKYWDEVNDKNLNELADIEGYRKDFLKLFGFGCSKIDYSVDETIDVDELSLGFLSLL